MDWKELKTPLDSLKPFEGNPRKISDREYANLKRSLEQDGYHQRIIATKDLRVIGGHHRLKALQEMGVKEVAVLVPEAELSDEEFKRIMVRDNLPFGEFDFDMLADSFDIDELLDFGVPDDIIDAVRGTLKPDAIERGEITPELEAEAFSRLGDTWMLGVHRLRCGDSTNAEDVQKLLAGETPHLMVTDPPYGVQYDASWREGHDLNLGKKIGGNFSPRATGKVENDNRADWREAWELFPGYIAYVWHGGLHSAEVQQSLEATGFKMRAQIIWAKQHFVFGRGDYHWKHEPCWYAVKNTGLWTGDRKQTTLWEINNNNPFGNGGKSEKKTGHSTQKPIECMKRPMENNSNAGDAVYEPFSGSGTTIIAAEMIARRCYAMELSPLYVD